MATMDEEINEQYFFLIMFKIISNTTIRLEWYLPDIWKEHHKITR